MMELPPDRKKNLLSEMYGTPFVVPYPLPLTKQELESLMPAYEDIDDNECDMNFYAEVHEFDQL
jgi:hypothetical protein